MLKSFNKQAKKKKKREMFLYFSRLLPWSCCMNFPLPPFLVIKKKTEGLAYNAIEAYGSCLTMVFAVASLGFVIAMINLVMF